VRLSIPRVNAPYNAAIDWLFGTQDRGVKLGLENVYRLLADMRNPQNDLRFMHVAGTNGKGSVCAMVDSICRFAGLRTGLFTSPHLVRFNERIQVNGVPIDDDAAVRGIQRIRAHIDEERHPTFFEITTALAFDYFRAQSVDLVILETGLGGRLDATNVVHPLVSVLTAIDLDHQHWLGDTLSKIAAEKAGIIKPGTPVVSGPQYPEVRSALEQIAENRSAPITFAVTPIKGTPIGLQGSHQQMNAAIATTAIEKAGIQVSPEAVAKGLEQVYWPGRFQHVEDRIILDGAHNPAAIARLIQTWHECVGQESASILFGGLRDKDLKTMIATLSPLAARFLLVPVRSQRSASTSEIERFVPKQIPVNLCGSAEQALDLAGRFDDRILVTGSLFLVGEVLAILDPAQAALQKSNQ
jgi:dihydrofolate synthase / folylpolyglutamate synthase